MHRCCVRIYRFAPFDYWGSNLNRGRATSCPWVRSGRRIIWGSNNLPFFFFRCWIIIALYLKKEQQSLLSSLIFKNKLFCVIAKGVKFGGLAMHLKK